MPQLLNDEEARQMEPDLAALQGAIALVPTDFPQARRRLEELAERGSIMARVHLTYALVSRGDKDEAKEWYRAAYEKGSSIALFSLASLLYHGGDKSGAERLWADGASQNDGPSMFCLASLYLERSDESKLAEVRPLLERAHASGQMRATLRLGKLLAAGKYGIQEIPKGIVLILQSTLSAFRVAYRNPEDSRLW
jgi:TPR repeat protein